MRIPGETSGDVSKNIVPCKQAGVSFFAETRKRRRPHPLEESHYSLLVCHWPDELHLTLDRLVCPCVCMLV